MVATQTEHNDANLLDAVTDLLRGSADLPIWTALATQSGGPVLECGAGTGRVLGFLLEAGLDAYGIELSDSVLQTGREALAHLNPTYPVRLLHGDMTAFDHDRRYRLVILPLNTVALLSDEEVIATLDCARRHLEPGCELALELDLHVVRPREATEPDSESWETPPRPISLAGRVSTLRQSFERVEGGAWRVTHRFQHPGGSTSNVALDLTVRSLEEITKLLGRAGWTVRLSVDEHGEAVSEQSRIAFVITRP
jgi:SAM-dependent methyltransferase